MKHLNLILTLTVFIICAVFCLPFVSCSTTSEYGVTETTKEICLVKTDLPTQEVPFFPTCFTVDSAANKVYCGNLFSAIPDFITLSNLTPKATEAILRAKKELRTFMAKEIEVGDGRREIVSLRLLPDSIKIDIIEDTTKQSSTNTKSGNTQTRSSSLEKYYQESTPYLMDKVNDIFCDHNNASHKYDMPCYPRDFIRDGCYARAHFIHKIITSMGYNCEKIVLQGKEDRSSLGFWNGTECVNWIYHIAAVITVKENNEEKKLVIDPSIDSKKPLSVKEWSDAIQDSRCVEKPTIYDPTFKPEIVSGDYFYYYNGKGITDPYYNRTRCVIEAIQNGESIKEKCLRDVTF